LSVLSPYRFRRLRDLPSFPHDALPIYLESVAELRGRTMVCRAAAVLPVELVVRGHIAGSGWKDYFRTGTVCGIPLPGMLRESDRDRKSTRLNSSHQIISDALCCLTKKK